MAAEDERFPLLEKTADRLGERTSDLSMDELRALLCADCDFYGDDHEDDLECSCFRMLRLLLVRGVVTPASLADNLAADSDTRGE